MSVKLKLLSGRRMQLEALLRRVGLPAAMTLLIILGVSRPILSLAAFAILAAYLFFATPSEGFDILFYLAPFSSIFKMSPASASMITYLELMVVVRMLMRSRTLNRRFLGAWLVLLCYNLAGFDMQVTTLIKQSVIPLMIYCFFAKGKPDFGRITVQYAWGLLISSMLALFMNRIPNLTAYVVYDRAYDLSGIVYRFGGMYSDPNYYSNALILAMSGILLLITQGRLKSRYYGFVLAFIFFGSQTMSKSFLLMLAIVAVAYVFMQVRQKNYWFALAAGIVLLMALVLLIGGELGLFRGILARFSGSNLLTNRDWIWNRYLEELSGNAIGALVGHGIGSPMLDVAAHNTYLDFLYYYGVAGTLLFLLTCWFACGDRWPGKPAPMNWLPALLLMVCAVSISMLMYFDLVFNLIYVLCALRERSCSADRRLK